MRRELQARRDLGRILDDTFALYREHWRTVLPATAAVVIPIEVGVLGIGLGWLWEDHDSARSVGETLVATGTRFLLSTPLATAIAVHAAVEGAAARRPDTGQAVTYALEAFRFLFPAMLLVAVGVTLGLVAFVVPGIYFAIRWALVPQVVVIEGRRGGEALRGSQEHVAGRWWWTLGVVLVANLLVGALSAIVLVPMDLLASELDSQAVSLAGMTLAQVATLPLAGFATTLLYFSLVTAPDASEPPPDASEPPQPPPPPPGEPDEPSPWDRRRREGWEPPGS